MRAKEKHLTSEQTVIILEDFGNFAKQAIRDGRRVMEGWGIESEEHEFEGPEDWISLLGNLRHYGSGIVWFGKEDEAYDSKPIGIPQDYLKIRDNYGRLRKFITDTLDRGRIDTSTGGHGGGPSETNSADYISFLHFGSENEAFQQNVEKAVVELLEEEFERDFEQFDYQAGRQEAEDGFERVKEGSIDRRYSYLSQGKEGVRMALWRLGLNYPEDPDAIRMKALAEEELGATARPMTESEYLSGYAGSDEENKERYIRDEAEGKLKSVVHFSETSSSFKEALLEFSLDREAKENASAKFAPQFNRLVGLLDVVMSQGAPDNGLADLYETLRRKAEEGFYQDTPDLEMGITAVNLQNHALLALAKVQPGDELRDYWLENIATDPHKKRAMTAVDGVLRMDDDKMIRRDEIPAILASLRQRSQDLDVIQQTFPMPGIYYEETLMTMVFDHMADMCYGSRIFHHLVQETGTLDYLTGTEVAPGQFTYQFDRYSPDGRIEAEVVYNLGHNALREGEESYLQSVEAHIDERGFKLTQDVWMTSLVGRKIVNADDTRVVEIESQPVGNNVYEGIVSFNHAPFPFLYDADLKQVTFGGEPIRSTTRMFSGRDSWEKRRVNLDEVEKKTSITELVDLGQMGQSVDKFVEQERERSAMGAAVYSLEGNISSQLKPYILKIFEARLITHSQDLVE